MNPPKTERNLRIVAAYRAGRTLCSIAEEFGLSEQRVRSIARAYGCEARSPGRRKDDVLATLPAPDRSQYDRWLRNYGMAMAREMIGLTRNPRSPIRPIERLASC